MLSSSRSCRPAVTGVAAPTDAASARYNPVSLHEREIGPAGLPANYVLGRNLCVAQFAALPELNTSSIICAGIPARRATASPSQAATIPAMPTPLLMILHS